MNNEFEVRSDESKRSLKFIFGQVEGYFTMEQEGGITRWKVHWGDRLAEWNSEMQDKYFSHFVKGNPEHDALAEALRRYNIKLLMLVVDKDA